ncbi:MAG: hypothetical protein WA902_01310 [Thermosynechococcaceae cyanobacterium]
MNPLWKRLLVQSIGLIIPLALFFSLFYGARVLINSMPWFQTQTVSDSEAIETDIPQVS